MGITFKRTRSASSQIYNRTTQRLALSMMIDYAIFCIEFKP